MKHFTSTLTKPQSENPECGVGFDIWGTLLDLDKVLGLISEEVAQETGLSVEASKRTIYSIHDEARLFRRRNPDASPSSVIEVSRRLIAERLKLSDEAVMGLIKKAFTRARDSVVFDDVIPAMEMLHERDVLLGLVGNVLFWPSDLTVELLSRAGILKYVKALVFSDRVGCSKPDRKIFQIFAAELGLDPSRIVYVGDNVVEDVGGALSAGFYGVLINRKSRIEKIYIPELRAGVINTLLELPNLLKAIYHFG